MIGLGIEVLGLVPKNRPQSRSPSVTTLEMRECYRKSRVEPAA